HQHSLQMRRFWCGSREREKAGNGRRVLLGAKTKGANSQPGMDSREPGSTRRVSCADPAAEAGVAALDGAADDVLVLAPAVELEHRHAEVVCTLDGGAGLLLVAEAALPGRKAREPGQQGAPLRARGAFRQADPQARPADGLTDAVSRWLPAAPRVRQHGDR